MKSMRYKQLERLKGRSAVRKERKNKTIKHINNGLVGTLTRAERKIRDAFNNVSSGK